MAFNNSYTTTEKYKKTKCVAPKICSVCEKMITKGEIKITDTGSSYFVMHENCFKDLMEKAGASDQGQY